MRHLQLCQHKNHNAIGDVVRRAINTTVKATANAITISCVAGAFAKP